MSCDYCAITKNYNSIPVEYKKIEHYIKNEMTYEQVITGLSNIKDHNPNAFHIFYGGEPLLYKDLPKIIKYCNNMNIFYTIISNNTDMVQPMIKKLFDEVGSIQGFTSSVDPINILENKKDRIIKSIDGLKRLKDMQEKGIVKDVVAEITCMNNNLDELPGLIEELSNNGIYSDITFVDIAKSVYYDFSNVTDENILVKPSLKLAKYFIDFLNNPKVLIHMKDIILDKIFSILPSNMNCSIDKSLHNITIDADGSLRLCLRIRGTIVPKVININNLFYHNGDIAKNTKQLYNADKQLYCKMCNHTCLLMSDYIDSTENGMNELVHSDKRG